MRFSAPAYLALLGVAVWMWRARSARAVRTAVARTAAAVLLVLAIAGLEIRGGRSPLSVTFVVDRSASMSGGEDGRPLETVAALSRGMRPDDTAAVVVFGADAAVERRPARDIPSAPIASRIDNTGTNIAGALRLARATLGGAAAGRIVLLTDGRETSGRALDEAARLATEGVPIDVVLPGPRTVSPFSILRLTAPPSVRVGEPFVLTALVSGRPGERGEIDVTADGAAPQRMGVSVGDDGLAAVSLRGLHERPGMYTYRAVPRGGSDDFAASDAEAGAVVAVSGEPVILHVGEGGAGLVQVLRRGRFQVRRATSSGMPRAAGSLGEYDGIILNDVDPTTLHPAQTAALAEYVEARGGGLLVLGSPRSLHMGLRYDDPLGRLLPIDLRRRSGQRAPGLALVIVFDKSGSMDDRVGGVPKIEFARQAIGRVLDSIPASDGLGVIAFDAGPVAVAPLAAGQQPTDLASRLRGIEPGGATALAPALDLARQWLRDASVGVEGRHILLVSDGRTSAADAARAREIAAGRGFQLTAVALGGDADRRFLASLSESTGGRAYFPDDVRELPSILAREAVRVSGGGIVQEAFRPRASEHPLLSGLDTSAMPRLGGYVASALEPSAAAALASHLDDPILAVWHVGLGKAGVYTADLDSAWSAGLREWNGFAALMTQTVRWLGRSAASDGLYARVAATDRGLALTVEAPAPDGGVRTPLECRATVRAPDGRTQSVTLRERTPGRCDAEIPASTPGPYAMSIEATERGGTFAASTVRGLYWSPGRERSHAPADTTLLRTLAAATGGRILAASDTAFSAPRPPAYLDLGGWLAGAALAIVLVELFGTAVLAAIRTLRRRAGSALAGGPADAGHYDEAA